LLEDREYDEVSFDARPGDSVLLHSDGFEDQTNPAGEEFGSARIFRALKRSCSGSAKSIVDGVFADLEKFMDGAPMNDDQTLIVIKVT
jgi:sigma-B regulation protein RsbU (phosphoserine phosphatase)